MEKETVLEKYFGYRSFRPGQAEVIDALLAGRDVLALMPTGAGKSLCYQIPAVMNRGLALVISPLISLMKDQARSLAESGISAACLNSSLAPEEYGDTLRRAGAGEFRLLYVAPERLLREDARAFCDRVSVSMVVIDEAHCVSQWGHDFRPSYMAIAPFIRALRQRPPVAAFTATATERVRADIERTLELREPFSVSTGFDRPNLYFEVRHPGSKSRELLAILETWKDRGGELARSGIVYCSTRKNVEEVCALLCEEGYEATRYHAGLDDAERRENQDDFLYDRKTIMVATNAFGMGIDKSNVSFVIHYNMPKNIESYYQEAGRAGRDGEEASCILLYSGKDVHTNEYLIKHGVDPEAPGADVIIQNNLNLLREMTFYATTTDCLRSRLLAYFGETGAVYCGNCSNCRTNFEKVDITIEAQKIISCVFRLKQRNMRFGAGMVTQILRGGKAEKLLALGLDTLSTYGIMEDTEARRISDIISHLVREGYLARTGDLHPVLAMTEKSREIVVEKKSLAIMLPKTRNIEPVKDSFARVDENLLARLKELRLSLARKADVPAYIVFTDAALHAMCTKLPKNRREFLSVPGVGERKADLYCEEFTALIREYTG